MPVIYAAEPSSWHRAPDAPASLRSSAQVVVALEYWQVYLEPMPGALDDGWAPPDDLVALLHQAFEPGIATGTEATVFVTPHRGCYPMPLRVELWDHQPPADDLIDWPEAFETSVLARGGGIYWSSPTLDGVVIPVDPGWYGARICGRDFFRPPYDDADGAVETEKYRLQLWPSADREPPRRLRQWTHPPECGCV